MAKQMLTEDFQADFSLKKVGNTKLIIGMTTRNGGESTPPFSSLNLGLHVHDNKYNVIQNRELVAKELSFPLKDWVCAEQIHGATIMEVTEHHRSKGVFSYEDAIKATDGLYTKQPNILLTAAYADCVPIYFAVDHPSIVGIAHAGWKGTTNKIAGNMIQQLQQHENVKPDKVHVYIGPSIGACCYEVDERVIAEVKESCKNSHLTYQPTDKGYMLNLKELNKQILLEVGVLEQHISVSPNCTSCDNELFFSHRKEKGKTGRMFGFIGMKQED
jgi:polyphenol oxidase